MSIFKPQNILSIQSRDEFRQWLMTHHATEKECWVKVKRGRPMDDEDILVYRRGRGSDVFRLD